MDDLNDLSYFVLVVRYQGFSAAARATGVEKTRLCRRVAALEQMLGARLLQRNTRRIALTEAGQRFYADSVGVVEAAQLACERVAILRGEPAGAVRIKCTQVMAAGYLTPILSGYLARHPKVRIELDLSDTEIDSIGERFDIALRSSARIDSAPGLVARALGHAYGVLLASAVFLDRYGRPDRPEALSLLDAVGGPADMAEGHLRWTLQDAHGRQVVVSPAPRLLTGDLQIQLAAVAQGVGIGLLPAPVAAQAMGAARLERVLPFWEAPKSIVYAVYPSPRGMLPSVRSVIDYLVEQLPVSMAARRGLNW